MLKNENSESLKEQKAMDMTFKIFHDLEDIKSVKELKKVKLVHELIEQVLDNSELGTMDSITMLKNITLRTIHISTLKYLDHKEKKELEKMQEDMK